MSEERDAGEDDHSTEQGGDDSHLHEDQKWPVTHGKGEDSGRTRRRS